MAERKNLRLLIQILWTFLTNCWFTGFAEGRIYAGPLKNICIPGLNCYSCPGALCACPVGALQAVIGSWQYRISLYVGGFLMLMGAVFGRFVCGWLCPFGLVQDLIYRIPFIRKRNHFRADRILRWGKYIILAVFVILMPLFVVDLIGQGVPAFCKYICPSGTLMGALPLMSVNEGLRQAAGFLFDWKLLVLIVVLIAALVVYRPFCKYVCPLGAIYGLFNRISFVRLRYDENVCIHCGKCAAVCKMCVDPTRSPGSSECIQCGDCVRVCPTRSLSIGRVPRQRKRPAEQHSECRHGDAHGPESGRRGETQRP